MTQRRFSFITVVWLILSIELCLPSAGQDGGKNNDNTNNNNNQNETYKNTAEGTTSIPTTTEEEEYIEAIAWLTESGVRALEVVEFCFILCIFSIYI